MLNEKNLKLIFGIDFPVLNIKDIHWRAQESDENSLLFYRIGDDLKSIHQFGERIKKAKFSWLIVNKPHVALPQNATILSDEKWPEIQKKILDILFPLPKIKLIAITGTNGKTTTTDLVLQLAHKLGKKGLSIGTLGVRENGKTLLDFGLTSPSYIDLRKFLNIYGHDKDFCVMEASSHALIQNRLYGLTFDGAGWLSFSQDHLDYHHSMEAYFDAKSLIVKQLAAGAKIFIPTEQKSLFAEVLNVSAQCEKAPEIHLTLPLFFRARFNRNNLEVAKAIVEHVFMVNVPTDLNFLKAPDGRFYIRPYKSNYIVVDFAHTPDALQNICQGIREAFPHHALKVLFGCGGDRDRLKRPKMAEVVDAFADEIYVTSDNPRSEDPEQIIKDIVTGIHDTKFQIICERPRAVQIAFSELKENEVLLLAGKGHEDYILIKDIKYPYSDIREVDQFLARNSND
jgi:UDP-N-acetylmuramoyl-L-alanyl-D-glutamate--2,6-diaminopimelate ligase